MHPLPYTELQVSTNFSFLRGASHPEELVVRAKELGYRAIAITDRNTLAGVVRGYVAARDVGIPFIVGSSLTLSLTSNPPTTVEICVYPLSLAGYTNLSRLLTLGKRRAPKGECDLSIDDYAVHADGCAAILIPPSTKTHRGDGTNEVNFLNVGKQIREILKPGMLSIGISRNYATNTTYEADRTIKAAQFLGVPLVATNDVHYHIPERRPLQDVLTCIQNRCTIEQAGFALLSNGERYLKSVQELSYLFRDLPGAITRTCEIAEMAKGFSLEELRYEYPHEVSQPDKSSFEYLSDLTMNGAQGRYPGGIPEKVQSLIQRELQLIQDLRYEKYFLTCYDIVRFARSRNILCQGRGAAANSAVCFCLGITSVDPERIDLLFERFVSKERNEPPDIDIDFEHERREEVIQYIYEKYGRDRAALTAEVITFQPRSAVREVGKALGLSIDTLDLLSKCIRRSSPEQIEISAEDLGGASLAAPAIHNTFILANQILGFPRHLSQHVGGFIISEAPLCNLVPIINATMENRTTIEWDKDDIEALGMLKIDILALGMLTCIRKALELVNKTVPQRTIELYSIPAEDPAVYDMISAADTVGVFQIESRAQMSMLPRLKPRCFYDLVIEVAIVRPGPIQGNMVHPYLKRRDGREKAVYPDARVEAILGKTLGVPLFQEQAMRLSIALAGFSPGEAERLRRAIGAWKRNKGVLAAFRERIIEGMLRNGYSQEFAESCFNQIRGFSEYGFPESHAASFALLVYASAWLKKHHPAQFATALINSFPMGFYQPAQIIHDAKAHGVQILPVDINKSSWDCTIEPLNNHLAVRLGMRLVRGLQHAQATIITDAVHEHGAFLSVRELWLYTQVRTPRLFRGTLMALARSDAFCSMGLDRNQAVWEIRDLPEPARPLDEITQRRTSMATHQLPLIPEQTAMLKDYQTLGLSLRAHPLSFARADLSRKGCVTSLDLRAKRVGGEACTVRVAGLILVRQRPHTAKGFTFLTIEDEAGMINLVIKPALYEQHRKTIVTATALFVEGYLERTTEVIYVNVIRLEDLEIALAGQASRNFC